jgi:hypothetical protein
VTALVTSALLSVPLLGLAWMAWEAARGWRTEDRPGPYDQEAER